MNLLIMKFSEPTLIKTPPQPYCHFKYPQKFLEELTLDQGVFWIDIVCLLAFFVVLRVSGYFVLKYKVKSEKWSDENSTFKRTFFYLEGRQCTKNCSVPFNMSFVILWCTKKPNQGIELVKTSTWTQIAVNLGQFSVIPSIHRALKKLEPIQTASKLKPNGQNSSHLMKKVLTNLKTSH